MGRFTSILSMALFCLGACACSQGKVAADAGLDASDADGTQVDGDGDDGSVDGADAGQDGDTGPDGGEDAGGDDGGEDGGGDQGCQDPCPAPNGGLTWGCLHRFAYGINYAWHHFAGDFGGIPEWGQAGVSSQPGVIAAELEDMHTHGVSLIRWWVFPDFRGAGVIFDAEEHPTGLGPTVVADLHEALALAEQADVYLMLCLFSFDNFRPSQDVAGIWTPGIRPMVIDPELRQALLELVVRPFARAAAESPYAHRLLSWDVINEPEWAMQGASPYGDQDYTPNGELETVSHAEMELFVAEVIGVLRQESDALITVGGAAMKWAKAWSAVDVDFYQFHMYPWINDWWPYDGSPADYGVDDRPVLMGEFPTTDLDGTPYGDVVTAWWELGYAGALSWQYIEADPAGLQAVQAFAQQHPCETRY